MRPSPLAAVCSLLLVGLVTAGCIIRVTRADDDPLPNGGITGPPADCRGGPKEGPAHDGVEPAGPRFVGRFDLTNPAQARFQWSGTEIQGRFEGTSIHASMRVPIVYLQVFEDNCQQRIADYEKAHALDVTDETKALCSPFSPVVNAVCAQDKACAATHRACCKAVTTRMVVKIDDRPEGLLPVSQSFTDYTLAENLPFGIHTVRLHRGVEAFAGVFEFNGFTVPGGKLLPARVRDRRILVIGDSITCAYGIKGANAQCRFSFDTEDTFNSYSVVAGRALDADVEIVAFSGRGIWRNNDSEWEGTMPLLFDRTIPSAAQALNLSMDPNDKTRQPTEVARPDPEKDAEGDKNIVRHDFAKAPKPHVILVNLGTNDFFVGLPSPMVLFRNQYLAFVRDLRGKYGFTDAHIILAIPPMISDALDDQPRSAIRAVLEEVVALMKDPRVYMMEFLDQGVRRGMGCDFHPNLATHAIMAEQLTGAIRAKTCW